MKVFLNKDNSIRYIDCTSDEFLKIQYTLNSIKEYYYNPYISTPWDPTDVRHTITCSTNYKED